MEGSTNPRVIANLHNYITAIGPWTHRVSLKSSQFAGARLLVGDELTAQPLPFQAPSLFYAPKIRKLICKNQKKQVELSTVTAPCLHT